jgi:3-hydroxyacyl-[acyl-carrier-protein] dehydratase
MSLKTETPILNYADIQRIMPHRYPMLLVDAVYALEPGTCITAVKCVTGNEPAYEGLPAGADARHLAYPYSLVVESCGQAGGILWFYSAERAGQTVDGLPMFVSAKDCLFESTVLPGDTMEHRVRLERVIGDTIFMSGETWVGERRIARLGWLTAVLRPPSVWKR